MGDGDWRIGDEGSRNGVEGVVSVGNRSSSGEGRAGHLIGVGDVNHVDWLETRLAESGFFKSLSLLVSE